MKGRGMNDVVSRFFVLAVVASLVPACLQDGPDAPDQADTAGGKGDVWGTDDRVERYEITSASLREVARSEAGLVRTVDLAHDTTRDVWSVTSPRTLGQAQHLCAGERFADQPVVAYCSATLIADDIMVSAGHCFEAIGCQDLVVAFDVAYDAAPGDPMQVASEIPATNVYQCTEVLSTEYSVDYDTDRGADYAVFRLDRAVTGRVPAHVNWNEPLIDGTPAYVIGHPSGIPAKLAAGSILDGTTNPDFIEHDADVFGGNSGCGLFDPAGTLIGIHDHSSAQRYVAGPSGTCNVVAVCDGNAECPRKPHAYDLRALRTKLSPELRMQLGAPLN
jgi:hypothetical protein